MYSIYFLFSLLQKRNTLVYHESMPRKTLALLVGLVLVTIILFIIALQTGKKQPQQMQQKKIQATPTPDVAHTVLAMSPEVVEVGSGRAGSVDVVIDTSDNDVTAVQLELLYDPTMLSNVKIVSGPAFQNPLVLINQNDPITGRYTYAYGVQPNQKTVEGQGVVAKITFIARGVAGKQSQIIMQPTSLVTAKGVAGTVLKSGTGATIVIAAPTTKTTTTTPKVAAPTTAQ